MENRRYLSVLLLSLTLAFSLSCSLFRSTVPTHTETPTDSPPNNALVTEAPESDEEGVAQIVEGPVIPTEIQYPSLGSIAFDTDPSVKTSAEFIPGSETILELTDPAGLTWTLTVPANAFDTPQMLTMTALANARSEDVPGDLLGGLLLEPDGLAFNMPATLSVSGRSTTGQAFVLTGQNDGTKVEVAYMQDEPGAASIAHFSTVFLSQVDQEKTMEELYKKLNDSEKALLQEARELLKNKSISVPTPPSIPLECTSEAAVKEYGQLVEDFYQAVFEPEGKLIGKLLSIKRSKQLLGKETDLLFTLENRLMTRIVKKVRLLIKTYYGQEEKLDAVAAVALRVARSVALLEHGTKSDNSVLFIEEIGSWAASLIDHLLEDIRTEHNYRKISAVWKMAYWASLLGSDVQSVEEIQAKMERVLQFQMKLTWEMGIEGESKYLVQGEFPMRYLAKEVKFGSLVGSGKAEMISAKFESDKTWFVESAPFHVKAIITNFDPCRSTANVTVNRFYPDVENHFSRDTDGNVREIGPMALMQIAWETLYEDRKKTGLSWYGDGEVQDYYSFEINLRNNDVNAAYDMIETIDASPNGTLMGWFSVDLTHMPK